MPNILETLPTLLHTTQSGSSRKAMFELDNRLPSFTEKIIQYYQQQPRGVFVFLRNTVQLPVQRQRHMTLVQACLLAPMRGDFCPMKIFYTRIEFVRMIAVISQVSINWRLYRRNPNETTIKKWVEKAWVDFSDQEFENCVNSSTCIYSTMLKIFQEKFTVDCMDKICLLISVLLNGVDVITRGGPISVLGEVSMFINMLSKYGMLFLRLEVKRISMEGDIECLERNTPYSSIFSKTEITLLDLSPSSWGALQNHQGELHHNTLPHENVQDSLLVKRNAWCFSCLCMLSDNVLLYITQRIRKNRAGNFGSQINSASKTCIIMRKVKAVTQYIALQCVSFFRILTTDFMLPDGTINSPMNASWLAYELILMDIRERVKMKDDARQEGFDESAPGSNQTSGDPGGTPGRPFGLGQSNPYPYRDNTSNLTNVSSSISSRCSLSSNTSSIQSIDAHPTYVHLREKISRTVYELASVGTLELDNMGAVDLFSAYMEDKMRQFFNPFDDVADFTSIFEGEGGLTPPKNADSELDMEF